jgi:hypothetical protein
MRSGGSSLCYMHLPASTSMLHSPLFPSAKLKRSSSAKPGPPGARPCSVRGVALTIVRAAAFVQRAAPRSPQPAALADFRTSPKSDSAAAAGGPPDLGRAAHRARPRHPHAQLPRRKDLTARGALEGERKQVTVLFADLKGSMELLADRDREEARRILDPVLERMMEAVHRYEGTVQSGDGRRHHGALRGAPRPRGPRAARVLCRPADARNHSAVLG